MTTKVMASPVEASLTQHLEAGETTLWQNLELQPQHAAAFNHLVAARHAAAAAPRLALTGNNILKFDSLHRIADSLAVLDMASAGNQPQVVVGSSIGGWIALHLARLRPHAVKVCYGHALLPACFENRNGSREAPSP